MKSSTRDQIKGKFHELKGKAKAKAGQVTNDPNLKAEGLVEHRAGKVQKKLGPLNRCSRSKWTGLAQYAFPLGAEAETRRTSRQLAVNAARREGGTAMISRTLISAFCVGLASLPAVAAPPAATLSAFERYAAVVEGRIRSDYSTTKFLRILPDESKWARVHKGEALVESAQALGLKPDIAIPDGQVQHWVAAAFLPNATLDAVLPRLRNYNNRSWYMKPEIIASRLKDHHGDVFEVYLRLVEKSILSGVFDLDLRVAYRTERPGRLAIDSRSTSVVEVSDAFAPVGSAARDQGLLWALNHYWRILQMDGGLYIECEALVLSRPTPFMLGWIARPIIARAARESLIKTVHATILIMNSPDASASAESRSRDVQRVGDMTLSEVCQSASVP